MPDESIFATALAIPNTAARAAFLDRACAGNVALRKEVEDLLAAHAAPNPLDQPPLLGKATTEDHTATEVVGAVIAGRYKLVQEIGEGGMGAVWMAQQTEPVKRLVALKLIKAGSDSKGVLARFEAERQALAMMDHPNIAKVFDAGVAPANPGGSPIPYFVMELVKGVPITKFCDDRKLTPRQRLELFVPVCQAIQHAHHKGVIHRDIKPNNVLVALYDDRPVPKVIDFGVAKAAGQPLTEQTLHTGFGAVVGTPEYMSPEQANFNNLDIDTRSDVYALGVLLYELLAGSPPFARKELKQAGFLEILRLIREQEPPRPSSRLSTADALPSLAANRSTEPKRLTALLRGELDWISMKALEKDRNRRYETANGFAADVQRYLSGEPVQAVPPSLGYRAQKLLRKHSGPVTAAALLLLALVCGIVGTTLGLMRARSAESYADSKREEAERASGQAQADSERASQEAVRATANATETRRALNRMTVAKGIQLAKDGKLFEALPYFVQPLERGGLTPEEEVVHRTRIACYLRHTPNRPTLRHILFCDKPFEDRSLYRSVPSWNPRLTFSADGKRMLAATDELVYLWDLRTGKLLAKMQHSESVQTAKFGPDGKRVLTSAGNAIIWTWDTESGRRLDGRFVDWAGQLQRPSALLSLSPWQSILSFAADHAVYGRWFTSDSDTVIAEISDNASRVLLTTPKSLRFLDLNSNKLLGEWPNSWNWIHGGDIHWLSPDGNRLVHVRDGAIWVHDITTGKLVSRSINHQGAVEHIVFSSDGNRAMTLGDGWAQIWDAGTLKPLTRFRVTDSVNRRVVDSATFSPDNRLLACWYSGNGKITWWDVESGLVRETSDRAGDYSSFDLRVDGQQAVRVSRGNSGEVVLLEAALGWREGLVLPQMDIYSAVYSADGRTLATANKNGAIYVWDLCDQQEASKQHVELNEHLIADARLRNRVSSYGYMLDGKRKINVKTVAGSREIYWLYPHQFVPPDTAFTMGTLSPDQTRVITCGNSRQTGYGNGFQLLQLWDAQTRQPVGRSLEQKDSHLFIHAMFSADSQVAVVIIDQTHDHVWSAQIWNARTGNVVGEAMKHDRPVVFASFSPDSELLVTCCADKTARIWRAKNGEPTGTILRHGDSVTRAAFAPNGKTLATSSLDGTVRLWDVGTGIPVGVLKLKNGVAWDLAFHPNGSFIMVSSSDTNDTNALYSAGKIRIFDINSLQEVSPMVKGYDNSFDRLHFRSLKGGRFAFGYFDNRTWDLAPDTRPTADLIKLAQLYSQRRLSIEPKGGEIPLNGLELQSLLHELRDRYPSEFSVPDRSAVSWRIASLSSIDRFLRPAEYAQRCRWLAAELAEANWHAGERGNEDMDRDDYFKCLDALALCGRHFEAVAAADALAVKWPKDGDTLSNCAMVHQVAAVATRGEAILSDHYWTRSEALLRQAAQLGYKELKFIQMLCDLAKNGRHVDAVAVAESLAVPALLQNDSNTLYNCACICSIATGAVKAKDDAALADQYAVRAVAFLRSAATAGFTDLKHVQKDTDLDAIRERDDFKKLLLDCFK